MLSLENDIDNSTTVKHHDKFYEYLAIHNKKMLKAINIAISTKLLENDDISTLYKIVPINNEHKFIIGHFGRTDAETVKIYKTLLTCYVFDISNIEFNDIVKDELDKYYSNFKYSKYRHCGCNPDRDDCVCLIE